jgi:GH25 family lysozyme M1 (1,4-beta-N-acetylmuramidase)
MATTLGFDVSTYQHGLDVSKAPRAEFLVSRCTRGTDYKDPTYDTFRAQATQQGKLFAAYHFLYDGYPSVQAQNWAKAVGDLRIPCVIDVERSTAGGNPNLGLAQRFASSVLEKGGKPGFLYLPRWYWTSLDSPDLTWWEKQGWRLWASEYTLGYTKGTLGALWRKIDPAKHFQPYGGMTPTLWQFTSSAQVSGYSANTVDGNAFMGTRAELAATGGFYDFGVRKAPQVVDRPVNKPKRKTHADIILEHAKRGVAVNTGPRQTVFLAIQKQAERLIK